jgi:PTH1 family peptidyl-tRNA hydrolase
LRRSLRKKPRKSQKRIRVFKIMPALKSSRNAKSPMLIVGLGNPGPVYRLTRHNIGADVVGRLAKKWSLSFRRRPSLKSLVAAGRFRGRSVFLALPETFMNLCGEAVRSCLRKKRIPLDHLLVVSDDASLALGDLRVRSKGGSGGHNGMASVIEELGCEDFPRLRIGIGTGQIQQGGLSDYVLSRFPKKEESILKDVSARAIEAIECWLQDGIGSCMNHFNAKKKSDEREELMKE